MLLHLVYEKAHTASTRIRLVQMVPHLEVRGIACRVVAYPRGARARRALRDSLAAGDVVLIHRARPTPREARFWRALPAARIYDFDDAVMWGRRRGLRGAWTRHRRAAGFARALACADAATCGNPFLAAQCGDLPTAIVPSAVPLDVPCHTPRATASPFRVGWVGRATHPRFVREVGAALAGLARRGGGEGGAGAGAAAGGEGAARRRATTAIPRSRIGAPHSCRASRRATAQRDSAARRDPPQSRARARGAPPGPRARRARARSPR